MKTKLITTIMITLFLASITVVAVPVSAQPSEVWVDDDYTPATPTWGTTHFDEIQDGVDAVAVGGTVHVYEGIYDEQVVIGKSLTLQGVGDTTIIQPSGTGVLTSFYTLGTQAGAFWNGHKLASIISVENVGTAGVTVKDLKVDGVNVNGVPVGANYVVGISYGETAGTIDGVTVVNMNSVPVAARTYGMWLDAVSTSVSVEVKNSRISYYNKNGIIARGADLTVDIHDNTIIGPGDGGVQVPNGIVFAFEAGGTTSYNDISALHYALGTWLGFGIMGYKARDGLTIEYNVVHDSDVGIGPSSYGSIRYNEIYDCYQGIELEWAEECAYNTIECNEIHDNYYGIHLLGPGSPYYTGPGDEPGLGNTASWNNIYGNTEGVRNWDTTQIFKAENNWWGHASGPSGPGGRTNPAGKAVGKGDAVSLNVDWDPWLPQPIRHTPHDPVPPGLD